MVRFNLFEGSRRVALLLKVLSVLAVGIFVFADKPYVSLKLETVDPELPFTRAEKNCDSSKDASELISRTIDDDKNIWVNLCFRSTRYESVQRELVPYKVDDKGGSLGSAPYSTEVMAYTKERADAFKLTASNELDAHAEWSNKRREQLQTGLYIALGVAIGLAVMQLMIGWIVRGFMGIPWGQDRRPEASPPTAPVS